MLHASFLNSTAKLDISLLLKSSPSPPPPNTHPPFSRSISVPTSGSQAPIVSSPSTSTTSQFSTSTAPPNAYSAAVQQQQPQQQYQQQQSQLQTHGQTRPGPLLPTPASGSGSAISKRPPPTVTHPSASPAKKHNSKWGPDEDALTISLRGSGMKWEDISKRLPGRSVTACRLHYQNYLERRTPWDEEKKDKLARLYDRMKPEMWAKVAEDLQVPWRAAEAMHWAIGETDMARRAGVVPFSMAPAGYGEPSSTTTAASSSSASGMDPSGYTGPSSTREYGAGIGGRARSGLRQSSTLGQERDGGVRLGLRESHTSGGLSESEATVGIGEDIEGIEGRRRRRPVSEGSGDQGVVLPSLAEFEGGVPAYAGFEGDTRGERADERQEHCKERGGSQEAEEEDHDNGR